MRDSRGMAIATLKKSPTFEKKGSEKNFLKIFFNVYRLGRECNFCSQSKNNQFFDKNRSQLLANRKKCKQNQKKSQNFFPSIMPLQRAGYSNIKQSLTLKKKKFRTIKKKVQISIFLMILPYRSAMQCLRPKSTKTCCLEKFTHTLPKIAKKNQKRPNLGKRC